MQPGLGYLSQVRRLRRIGEQALKAYPIRSGQLKFINHGENTTFQVITPGSAKYLLRIHRGDYHTPEAIEEELGWLSKLSESGLIVPQPVRSRERTWLSEGSEPGIGSRRVSLFRWVEGRLISNRSVTAGKLTQVGRLLARIQAVGASHAIKHRRYWKAQGMLGAHPKFGSIDALKGIGTRDQRILSQARVETLTRLQAYERRFPERMGLIHADLHFGNLLVTPSGELGAIDFDDSGFGFRAYDLAIPLINLDYLLREAGRFREYARMKDALLDGYASGASWDEADSRLLSDLIVARKLLMLGWLQSRSDNPKLAHRLKKAARKAVRDVECRGRRNRG